MVQLLTICTDPERLNTQRYRRTDRRTDEHYDAYSRLYCVTVRSAKTCTCAVGLPLITLSSIFTARQHVRDAERCISYRRFVYLQGAA